MDNGQIQLNIANVEPGELLRYQEILLALIACGGLSGVKSGRTIIHFNAEGRFEGIELDYWPWKRRAEPKNVVYGRRDGDQAMVKP